MQVYQTDFDGFYIGKSSADPDPIQVGKWLIPGGCVTTKPPALTDGQRAKWKGNTWLVLEPVPEPEPEPEPELTLEELAIQARSKRNSLLAASDWTQVADAPVDQAAWATYRQALRDITTQAGFPESINWPTSP